MIRNKENTPERMEYKMEVLARRINRLKFISNTILANSCYHTKEMELQMLKAEKNGNMPDIEREQITRIWSKRNKMANELLILWSKYEEVTEK